mmetsp:Transcript_77086/g.213026  ORF Transcript_77086/g.213026 Transcript_77086/m.213026 type:complete len:204 (+) Transcript_77086:332-943(+)
MLQQGVLAIGPRAPVLLYLALNARRCGGTVLLVLLQRLHGGQRPVRRWVKPVGVLVLEHGLEVVPVPLRAAGLDRRPRPRYLPLRPGPAVQEEGLAALLLLPAVERRVEVSAALVGPLWPVILGLQVALGAAARAPRWTTADALPAIGLLTRELHLHAALHRELRLSHVGTVAPQLGARELHKLLEIAERVIGVAWKRRQGST